MTKSLPQKLSMIVIVGFVLALATVAQAKLQQVVCNTGARNVGGLGLNLDDSYFSPGSGFSAIMSTNWTFQYSSARLICDTHSVKVSGGRSMPIACIGYMSGAGGRIEFKGDLVDGAGQMTVHNLDQNPYADQTEGLKLTCTLLD